MSIVAETKEIVNDITPKAVSQVKEALRDIGIGGISQNKLQEMIHIAVRESFQNSGVMELRSTQRQCLNSMNVSEEEAQINSIGQMYCWNGRIHGVPKDMNLPSEDALNAWQLWCCGNPKKRTVPLRYLSSNDFSTMNLRKRFSDLKFLMTYIEYCAKRENAWKRVQKIEDANEIFASILRHLPLYLTTPKGQVSRPANLKWTTVVNRLRIALRSHT
jgi:hypothetical protein